MLKSQLGQNVLEAKFRTIDYDRHVQKVTDIVEARKQKYSCTSAAEMKEQFMSAKSGNIKFQENSRQNQINVKNEVLLCKLVEISQGKCCFLNNPEYSNVYQQVSSVAQRPLHLPFRQEKLRQIDEENKALAKRLFEQKSFINRDKLRKEIDEYEKLKKHMQKFKSLGCLHSKPSKLPPLMKLKYPDLEQANHIALNYGGDNISSTKNRSNAADSHSIRNNMNSSQNSDYTDLPRKKQPILELSDAISVEPKQRPKAVIKETNQIKKYEESSKDNDKTNSNNSNKGLKDKNDLNEEQEGEMNMKQEGEE